MSSLNAGLGHVGLLYRSSGPLCGLGERGPSPQASDNCRFPPSAMYRSVLESDAMQRICGSNIGCAAVRRRSPGAASPRSSPAARAAAEDAPLPSSTSARNPLGRTSDWTEAPNRCNAWFASLDPVRSDGELECDGRRCVGRNECVGRQRNVGRWSRRRQRARRSEDAALQQRLTVPFAVAEGCPARHGHSGSPACSSCARVLARERKLLMILWLSAVVSSKGSRKRIWLWGRPPTKRRAR